MQAPKCNLTKNRSSDTGVQVFSCEFCKACNIVKKETLARVFSCEFCEKNSFFIEHLRTTASAYRAHTWSLEIMPLI